MTRHGSDRDVWQFVDELGRAHHIIVWMIILEAERDDVYPINSSTVQRRMFRWTGTIPTSDRVLRSMNRLLEADIIDRTPAEDHPQGCDWRTTDDGREIASAISEKWAYVLGAADRGEGGQ